MEIEKVSLISDEARNLLNSFVISMNEKKLEILNQVKDEILMKIEQFSKMTNFRKPAEEAERIFLIKTQKYSIKEQIELKRSLIGILALNLPDRAQKMDLPDSILELFPDAFTRLAKFLKNEVSETYNNMAGDFFCKDIRFTLGLSVPCGVQLVDLTSKIHLKTLLLSFLRARELNILEKYFRNRGYRNWFEIHTESRYLDEFNESGWISCYLRLSNLLEKRKNISGFLGTSWFYDPQIKKVSPHLAYLQEYPRTQGAFFLRHGTQQSDIDNAIKKSEKRRRYFEKGEYVPVCYSMLWPRKQLIEWAQKIPK